MDELIRQINKYPNGTLLEMRWKNGLRIKGAIDTIYETDNGFEPDDERYLEFYACTLTILSIANDPLENMALKVGDLIEISMQNPPVEIMLDNGTGIWKVKDR